MGDRGSAVVKLSVYFGDAVTVGPRLSADVLMERFADHDVVAALLHGSEGYGLHRRIHAERLPDTSTDLPLLALAAGDEERIRAALDDVHAAVPKGLVTLEPLGPADGAAELTVFCERGHREIVDRLRRAGATGATALAGVDGVLGRRRRERLFRSGGAPMVVVSVGPAEVLEPLRASLPNAWLQPVALLKHAGEPLAPLPAADGWQAIRVYARRTHAAGGGALTRRLRQAGAAGATTLLGEWGFTGTERPFGDRFGRIASHRPTCTVFIDRAERVAELWPIVDELTAEHGTVTAAPVPVYREGTIGPRFGSSP
jgi:PII-like signaling protein